LPFVILDSCSNTLSLTLTLSLASILCIRLLQAMSPVDVTLTGVVDTSAGFFACGHEGIILNRTAPRMWEKVLEGGPTGNGNSLYTCSATDDGERLWFAGSSGAIGMFLNIRQNLGYECSCSLNLAQHLAIRR
jgi:hypothetical protein